MAITPNSEKAPASRPVAKWKKEYCCKGQVTRLLTVARNEGPTVQGLARAGNWVSMLVKELKCLVIENFPFSFRRNVQRSLKAVWLDHDWAARTGIFRMSFFNPGPRAVATGDTDKPPLPVAGFSLYDERCSVDVFKNCPY